MRRPPRNAPLWIVFGAAFVILAATFGSHARSDSAKTAAGDEVATNTPPPGGAVSDESLAEPSGGESIRTTLAEAVGAIPVIPGARASASAEPPSTEPVGAAGMVVGIDPETGKLGMPSREFRDALRESRENPALSRSMEGLQVVHRPDGSRMIDLGGRFQDYTVVRITPDGRKEQVCVQGSEVEAALRREPSAPPAEPQAAVEPEAATQAVEPEAATPAPDAEADAPAAEPEATAESEAPER